jgi:hypothetical protein
MPLLAGTIHAAGTSSWTNARNSPVRHLYPLLVASPRAHLQQKHHYKVRDPMMHLMRKCDRHLQPHLPPHLVPHRATLKYVHKVRTGHPVACTCCHLKRKWNGFPCQHAEPACNKSPLRLTAPEAPLMAIMLTALLLLSRILWQA